MQIQSSNASAEAAARALFLVTIMFAVFVSNSNSSCASEPESSASGSIGQQGAPSGLNAAYHGLRHLEIGMRLGQVIRVFGLDIHSAKFAEHRVNIENRIGFEVKPDYILVLHFDVNSFKLTRAELRNRARIVASFPANATNGPFPK